MFTNFLVPGADTESLETRIAYVLVQDSTVQRYSSVFRLVPEANVRLLRCFMAAALLPGDASRIRAAGRPFTKATRRVHDLPQIRITGSRDKPDETLWNGMMNTATLSRRQDRGMGLGGREYSTGVAEAREASRIDSGASDPAPTANR